MKIKISRLNIKHILTIILVIILAVCGETKFSFHGTSQKIVFSLIAIYGVILYLKNRYDKNHINSKLFRILIKASLPFIFAFLYTFIITSFQNEYNLPIAKHAFTTSMYAFIQMMFVFSMFLIFKEKAIDIIYHYICLSYLISITWALKENSITSIITNYNSINNVLERHDIGTAVVPIILLYLYKLLYLKEKNNQYIKRIIVCTVILFLCGKRAAFVAIIVGVIVLFVVSLKSKNKFRLFNCINFFTILILFLYVFIIQSGLLAQICNKFGISTQGRLYVWNWFSNMYTISPLYMGKGLQFVHEYMSAFIAEGGSPTSMVSMFGYLHNSDLQIYIELGFLGFFMWFTFYLFIMPKLIYKNFGVKLFYISSILFISMVFLFMTDNVMTYPIFQTTMYVSMFSIVLESQRKKNESGALYE